MTLVSLKMQLNYETEITCWKSCLLCQHYAWCFFIPIMYKIIDIIGTCLYQAPKDQNTLIVQSIFWYIEKIQEIRLHHHYQACLTRQNVTLMTWLIQPSFNPGTKGSWSVYLKFNSYHTRYLYWYTKKAGSVKVGSHNLQNHQNPNINIADCLLVKAGQHNYVSLLAVSKIQSH